jgi:hypothetical protein
MPCPNCRSDDVWDDVSGWGCNKCGWSSFGMLNTTRTVSNPNDRYEVENRPRDYDRMFGHDPGLNYNQPGRRAVMEAEFRERERERTRQDNERIHRDWKEEKAREERERFRKEQAQLRCPNNCGSQMVQCNGALACPICDADVVKRDGRYGYLYARRH